MLQGIKLLGTRLELKKDQMVVYTPADNLPQGGYFVRPARVLRDDLAKWGEDSSIHVNPHEIKIIS